MQNEFIIKINKDRNGEEVSLENISIGAADALNVFIGSLSDFAKTEKNIFDFRISLKNGCIETSLSYPSTKTEVDTDIQNIYEGNSSEEYKVKIFKNIQDKIKANGIDYSIIYRNDGQDKDLTSIFKAKKFTAKKLPEIPWFYDVIFVEGELFDLGGKVKVNAHIADKNDFQYLIDCNKEQAKRFGPIYENTFVSILRKYRPNSKAQHELIDVYLEKNKFLEYKSLYETVVKNNTLHRFDIIHDKIENILNEDISNGELLKLMRLYNNPQADRGIIRTVLMALKRVDKSEEITFMYNTLATLLKAGNDNKAI